MLQGEERWRRRRFRNERKIRHFVAAIGEVDGRRRLRRPRYAGEQDVRLLPILRADAIIMRDAELDGIDAGEILGCPRVLPAGPGLGPRPPPTGRAAGGEKVCRYV